MNEIITSWELNAAEWIKTISDGSISSRQFTNQAILDAILALDSNTIIDVGCGEGWLTTVLSNSGKQVVGIDAVEALLQHARSKSDVPFLKMTFEEITSGIPIPHGPFDLAVFNFCLYQKDGLTDLLTQTKKRLVKTGAILIQTLHPYFLMEQQLPYESQWLQDSWKGLDGNFTNGHHWFARTFEDWHTELQRIPDTKISFKEITNTCGKPLSLIITIKKTT